MSNAIKGDWRDDPNSPNNLSRRKWKCRGDKSMREEILDRIDELISEAGVVRPYAFAEDSRGNHVAQWEEGGKTYQTWFDKTHVPGRYDWGFGILNDHGDLDTHSTHHGVSVSNIGATVLHAMRHHLLNIAPVAHGDAKEITYQYHPVPDSEGESAGFPHLGKRASVYRRWWKSRDFGGSTASGDKPAVPAHPDLAGTTVTHKEEDADYASMTVAFPHDLKTHVASVKT